MEQLSELKGEWTSLQVALYTCLFGVEAFRIESNHSLFKNESNLWVLRSCRDAAGVQILAGCLEDFRSLAMNFLVVVVLSPFMKRTCSPPMEMCFVEALQICKRLLVTYSNVNA